MQLAIGAGLVQTHDGQKQDPQQPKSEQRKKQVLHGYLDEFGAVTDDRDIQIRAILCRAGCSVVGCDVKPGGRAVVV
ncbi:hypothetical protein U2071_15760, partial [Listeria monocytogenes]